MKRLQKGYGRFLSSHGREFGPHTLVLMDPDPHFTATRLFDAGPGELLTAPWPSEVPEAQEAFATFMLRSLENPSLENVVILDISRETNLSGEEHLRERSMLRFDALRRMPAVQYAQVTRGLRVLGLFFSVETGALEVFEHGTWAPFLAKENQHG